MVATFIIEIVAACYMVWRYKMDTAARLITALLVFLAIFQLAEYMICGSFGMDGMTWSRIGYVSITFLPPLGIHLATVIAKKKLPWLVGASYASMLAFIFFFAYIGAAITSQVCQGNYVIFDMAPGSVLWFTLYYYGWLLAGVVLCIRWAQGATKAQSRGLHGLAFGYLAFILPTTTVNIIDPATMAGIPSIMCGFAVLLALLLVFRVAPAVAKRR